MLPNATLITEAMLDYDRYKPTEINRMLSHATIEDLFVLDSALEAAEEGKINFDGQDLQEFSESLYHAARENPEDLEGMFLRAGDVMARLHSVAKGR